MNDPQSVGFTSSWRGSSAKIFLPQIHGHPPKLITLATSSLGLPLAMDPRYLFMDSVTLALVHGAIQENQWPSPLDHGDHDHFHWPKITYEFNLNLLLSHFKLGKRWNERCYLSAIENKGQLSNIYIYKKKLKNKTVQEIERSCGE